jgi:hypothetical protein
MRIVLANDPGSERLAAIVPLLEAKRLASERPGGNDLARLRVQPFALAFESQVDAPLGVLASLA